MELPRALSQESWKYTPLTPNLLARKHKPRWAIALGISLALVLSWFLLPYETKSFLLNRPSLTACDADKIQATTCNANQLEPRIPNIVHFVYILADQNGNFPFQFSHFLSIYAAWYRWRPETIYLHTNVAADSEAVARARDGSAGKWSKLIFDLPLTINTVEPPTHASNGVEITGLEHQSDFVRVKAVYEFGGIYIDTDVHALRNVDILRNSGFGAIAGRQVGGNVNSGSFMSEKGGKMIKLWWERMNEVYNGGWTTHSNSALTYVTESLEPEPCEMLILGRDAFAPGGWWQWAMSNLFSNHKADIIPFTNATEASDAEPVPSWATDWSCSYLLHAFSASKIRHGVKHNGISPRYVLERGSNYARAVYPVAKDMFDRGLIDLNDTDTGR